MDLDRTTAASPDFTQYSPKWQFRFGFFDRYGGPKSPEYKQAFKALKFGERIKVQSNFFAFFFGFIYFFILGLWRKALVVLGISVALGVLSFFVPDAVARGLGVGYSVLLSMSANYAYYLEKVKGSRSWNPFEGLF
jgi:hypothetical protein